MGYKETDDFFITNHRKIVWGKIVYDTCDSDNKNNHKCRDCGNPIDRFKCKNQIGN